MTPLNEQDNRSNQLDKNKSADWIDGYFSVWLGLIVYILIVVHFVGAVFWLERNGISLISESWSIPYSETVIKIISGACLLWFVVRFLVPVFFSLGALGGITMSKLHSVNLKQVFAIVNDGLLRMVFDVRAVKRLWCGKN